MSDKRLSYVRLAILLVLIFAIGCTETEDDLLFLDIGVTRLFPLDTGQQVQNISTVDSGIPGPYQVTEWTIRAADLELDGMVYDLLFGGQSCSVAQTVAVVPVVSDPCNGGIVIEALSQAQTARLVLGVGSMQVRRAEPISGVDIDGDGIPGGSNPCVGGSTFDCSDNCPLVSNPLQEDPNLDGVGAACEVLDSFTGARFPDNDLDGISDSRDNCIWVPNPGQENTMGLSAAGLPDQIGDACVEQIAQVRVNGNTEFQIDLSSTDLVQNLFQISYLTVEFNGQEALDCDWDAGRCTLDPDQIRFCSRESLGQALGGC